MQIFFSWCNSSWMYDKAHHLFANSRKIIESCGYFWFGLYGVGIVRLVVPNMVILIWLMWLVNI